ncbi:MAG: hypothetical protein PHQ89_00685 [Bacilli bacterium]|nr:hypothetical protein [Bacilli bacterium]
MVLIKNDYTSEEKEKRKEKAILELKNWKVDSICLNCGSRLTINMDSFINIINYKNIGEDINQYDYKCPYCNMTFCLFESAIFNDDLNIEKREYLAKYIKNNNKQLLNNSNDLKTPGGNAHIKKCRKSNF